MHLFHHCQAASHNNDGSSSQESTTKSKTGLASAAARDNKNAKQQQVTTTTRSRGGPFHWFQKRRRFSQLLSDFHHHHHHDDVSDATTMASWVGSKGADDAPWRAGNVLPHGAPTENDWWEKDHVMDHPLDTTATTSLQENNDDETHKDRTLETEDILRDENEDDKDDPFDDDDDDDATEVDVRATLPTRHGVQEEPDKDNVREFLDSFLPSPTYCRQQDETLTSSSNHHQDKQDKQDNMNNAQQSQKDSQVHFRNCGLETWLQCRQAWRAPPPTSDEDDDDDKDYHHHNDTSTGNSSLMSNGNGDASTRKILARKRALKRKLVRSLGDGARQCRLPQRVSLRNVVDAYTTVWGVDTTQTDMYPE